MLQQLKCHTQSDDTTANHNYVCFCCSSLCSYTLVPWLTADLSARSSALPCVPRCVKWSPVTVLSQALTNSAPELKQRGVSAFATADRYAFNRPASHRCIVQMFCVSSSATFSQTVVIATVTCEQPVNFSLTLDAASCNLA